MSSLAANVGKAGQGIPREPMFDACTPLLHIRPNRLHRDGSYIQREGNWGETLCTLITRSLANGAPALGIDLSHAEHDRRRTFERTSIRFVGSSMLEENAISASDRSLPCTGRIPGESNTRCWIQQVPGHAARRPATHPALHNAVGDDGIDCAAVQVNRNWNQSACLPQSASGVNGNPRCSCRAEC